MIQGGLTIKAAAFYLISLLLLQAFGAAQENVSAPIQGAINIAIPVSNLSQDNASDLLAMNITSDQKTNAIQTEISALRGDDGSTLWKRNCSDCIAFASPAGDLNGDGRTDVMVNVLLAGIQSVPYSFVTALDGSTGIEIWSRPQVLAATFAYPIKDITGDDASDFLVHIIGIDSLNGTVITKIEQIDGANGTELSAKIFTGAVALEYPAGNFTDDNIQDSIAAAYVLDESTQNITTNITAIDGQGRKELWNRAIESFALAVPVEDLTGDERDELLVYLIRIEGNDTSNELAVLEGNDGKQLWKRSFGNILPFATAGPDLTGDGRKDLIVYMLGEFQGGDVLAIKGDDGKLLWSKAGMIILPQ